MSIIHINNSEIEAAYKEATAIFRREIGRPDIYEKIKDDSYFTALLSWGMSQVGATAAELAQDEGIKSSGTISKWLNGAAAPALPTRKTVINWLKTKADSRLDRG